MSVRLDEINERASFMKTSLQSADLRLGQLEEWVGRMAGLLESLVGSEQLSPLPTRSRASSECDVTFLHRQSSLGSADGYSLYRYHFNEEEASEAGPHPVASALGSHVQEDTDLKVPMGHETQRPPHLLASADTPASEALDSGKNALELNPSSGGVTQQEERPVEDPQREDTGPSVHLAQAPCGQSQVGLPSLQLSAQAQPVGQAKSAHFSPEETPQVSKTIKSRSFAHSRGGRKSVGMGKVRSGSVLDRAQPAAPEQRAPEWTCQVQKVTRSRSTEILGFQVATAPHVPHLCPAGKGNLLSVSSDQSLRLSEPRSRSLHGHPRKTHDNFPRGLGGSGHTGHARNLAPGSGLSSEEQKVP